MLNKIPGTKGHAAARVDSLFNESQFDRKDLTTDEAVILDESIEQKYKPSVLESERSRYLGALIGLAGSPALLVILTLVLATIANSMTASWFSISLEKMKSKLSGMGLNLTTDLLKAEMSASSLAAYTGVGYAAKLCIEPVLMLIENPNPVNLAKAGAAIAVVAVIVPTVESVIRKKERASIQFDFNDATLGGMSESQQKFFNRATNNIANVVDSIRSDKGAVTANREILRGLSSILEFVDSLDIAPGFISEGQKVISDLKNNYDKDTGPFNEGVMLFFEDLKKFIPDERVKNMISDKTEILRKKDLPQAQADNVVADLFDLFSVEMERSGEKLFQK